MSFGIKQAGVAKRLRRPLPIKRISSQPVAGDCGFDPHRWLIFLVDATIIGGMRR